VYHPESASGIAGKRNPGSRAFLFGSGGFICDCRAERLILLMKKLDIDASGCGGRRGSA
jgi:hypothetical protein